MTHKLAVVLECLVIRLAVEYFYFLRAGGGGGGGVTLGIFPLSKSVAAQLFFSCARMQLVSYVRFGTGTWIHFQLLFLSSLRFHLACWAYRFVVFSAKSRRKPFITHFLSIKHMVTTKPGKPGNVLEFIVWNWSLGVLLLGFCPGMFFSPSYAWGAHISLKVKMGGLKIILLSLEVRSAMWL